MSLLIKHFYRFGAFTLDTDQRVLLRDGKPLALTPKVFDTLLILVEKSGRIVEREELMNRLWPDTFVEEANLTFNIKQLRKVLGDDARNPLYIETVARRGYRMIADAQEVLMETGAMNDHIAPRFDSSDASVSDITSTASRRSVGSDESKPVESPIEIRSAKPEEHLDATATSAEASTGLRKRAIALIAGIAIVIIVAGLVVWKLAANKTASEHSRADAASRPAVPLKLEKLTGTGQSDHVAISPDGKFIAYTQSIEKQQSIWLRQLATNTNVEIVPASGHDPIYCLQFANSGDSLYFSKANPTALYRVSLLGGAPTRIADSVQGGDFSISADDTQISFVRKVVRPDGQRENSLFVVNLDGSGERNVLTTPHPETVSTPLWLPSGKAIICSYYSPTAGVPDVRLIEIAAADGSKKELSSESFFSISRLAWLPDKSGLIMAARKKHENDNQLWRVNYPGMGFSQITEDVSNYEDLSIAAGIDKAAASQALHVSQIWVGSSREPQNLKKTLQGTDNFCWTPNGQLVYSSKAGGNVDLWTMQSDGRGQRQLTVNPAIDGMPAVTPDGRYIVFVSNRTGPYELWRMNMDGGDQIQLTKSGGIRPAVTPDGRWVLYNTLSWHLWKVSIDGGEPIRIAERVGHFPSVSPDGKMIACMGKDANDKLSIIALPVEGGPVLKSFDFTTGRFRGFRIQWTADGKALIYGVARDGVTALIKQSLDGGPPEEIMGFDEDELMDFGYSFDRKFLAITRARWQHDIVLINELSRH